LRLKSDDLIAGVPARQLRDLLSFYHTGLRVEGVAHRLKIEQGRAAEIIQALVDEEFLEPADSMGWHGQTAKGAAVQNARFIKPMPRARAEALLTETIERCRAANDNEDFVFYVAKLHVFGSHLSDSPDLGDLDLVVEVEQRPGVNSIVEASKARFQASGRTARSYPEELMYGRREVMRFVKGRSPYLSLHDRNELTEGGATAAKVVFEADDVKPWRQP
jgi:hypothetical protein